MIYFNQAICTNKVIDAALNEKLAYAFELISSGKIDNLELGHHDFTDDIGVNVMEYETKIDGLYESHKKYIDVHYVISGNEYLKVVDESCLFDVQEYNEKIEALLGKCNEAVPYAMPEKSFCVVFPGEAHLPGIINGKPEKVKKAVIKLLI